MTEISAVPAYNPYPFLLRSLLNSLALGNLPSPELNTLMTLLFGMLGLGVYRTREKVRP
ncbi:hypothetical protein ABGV49_15915 [Chromobacterium vaccinii]|uniref:PEP-CTERM protein-sorting domain-containing protein n=1 Tax=Chromobacterium vaccinii TaxID=1108595 RepID=A0ABV0FHI8_9NEIS